MRRVTMRFFVILLCLLSAAVVLPGYLSGYRDRKDLKYLPFDLPPPESSPAHPKTLDLGTPQIYRMEESVIPPDNTFYYHTVGFITTLVSIVVYPKGMPLLYVQQMLAAAGGGYASLPPFDCC